MTIKRGQFPHFFRKRPSARPPSLASRAIHADEAEQQKDSCSWLWHRLDLPAASADFSISRAHAGSGACIRSTAASAPPPLIAIVSARRRSWSDPAAGAARGASAGTIGGIGGNRIISQIGIGVIAIHNSVKAISAGATTDVRQTAFSEAIVIVQLRFSSKVALALHALFPLARPGNGLAIRKGHQKGEPHHGRP